MPKEQISKKLMKIAIFTDTFLPKYDGIVTSTLNLATGLADKGHQIYIITARNGKQPEFKYKNVIVKRVRGIPGGFYPEFRMTNILSVRLIRYLKKEGIELIHFQTPITLGIQAILSAKYLKIPLVGTFHTFITDEEYLKHVRLNKPYMKKVAWAYIRGYYNRPQLVTVPSESAKEELYTNGITKPIKVISNGINLKIFETSKAKEIHEKYNPRGKILLFVGRIAHEKNLNYLLDCFKIILQELPSTKLLIIGDGPQMGEIKERIKKENLNESIILLGQIPHEELIKSSIIAAADVFITASLTENQPMTLLEAQANGTACVGINTKGIKDVIQDGYNGFLANKEDKKDFANKVLKILRDKKLQQILEKNAKEEAKKYDYHNIINIWEQEYSKLIADK
ncbi:glycosyltransferase family 4 protein [Candidatus Woesearchaeota archaeon]|nr:glycosyltransferase family 4 protein [Candidatus Woesearchaeota archaeon]